MKCYAVKYENGKVKSIKELKTPKEKDDAYKDSYTQLVYANNTEALQYSIDQGYTDDIDLKDLMEE